MNRPVNPFAAVIFDMDGVLIDSEPLWKIAEIEGFAKVGLNLTKKDCEATVGVRIDEVVRIWYDKVGWTGPGIREVSEDIVDILIREIKRQGIALPGVNESLEMLKNENLAVGLATSSSSRIINVVLDRFHLRHYFTATHSAENETLGKPHPAVYLNCAAKLGVIPKNCLAIEDSFNGVLSAKAAGMKVIAIPEKSHSFNPRIQETADCVLNNLCELTPDLIRKLR